MEKPILKVMDEIASIPNVVGAVVADKDGLCIAAQGSASKTSAGLLSSISIQANQLSTGASLDSMSPVVIIETEDTCVFVKTDSDVTTAIYKSTS